MQAVMYGGGNIGRGFIGTVFSQSGYHVTFVDVAQPVIDALNEKGAYPVRIVESQGHQDVLVKNVCAVNGNDQSAVAEAIANADIMATAVGVNILKFIIPNLVAGIRRRMALGKGPLNILICENLMDANHVLEGMLKEQLTPEEQAWMDENIGLVEASIGRMVPVQTDAMKDGDPMRVCVERYGYLPVDKAAFKGGIPNISNMVPFDPFDFYLKRKLYIHNMGHAICAYLGNLYDLTYIWEAIDRDEIYIPVRLAMEESALALSKKYGVALGDILSHINDLLNRFTNRALGDTCARVGGDPKRKLSPADRLIGASQLALEHGIDPCYMALGTAAAVIRYLKEQELEQNVENARSVLADVCQLPAESPITAKVLDFYGRFQAGESLSSLRRYCDMLKKQTGII